MTSQGTVLADKRTVWELEEFKSNVHEKSGQTLAKVILLVRKYEKKFPEEYKKDKEELDKAFNDKFSRPPGVERKTPGHGLDMKKNKWAPMNTYDKLKTVESKFDVSEVTDPII